MSKTIAIVEDEIDIADNYREALQRQGYEVRLYASREAALNAFKQRLPHLVLLDIGLKNDYDGGFELCRMLRGMSESVPIIFLTARDSDFDTISGLRLGADDYLIKDISLPHLCARIAALFRRIDALNQPSDAESVLEREDLALDMNRYVAHWKQTKVDLTLTEFWLVYSLALHPGHVKSREKLMQDAHVVVDDATITSHIKRIRRKFCEIDPAFSNIDTVYGMGYRWSTN